MREGEEDRGKATEGRRREVRGCERESKAAVFIL